MRSQMVLNLLLNRCSNIDLMGSQRLPIFVFSHKYLDNLFLGNWNIVGITPIS